MAIASGRQAFLYFPIQGGVCIGGVLVQPTTNNTIAKVRIFIIILFISSLNCIEIA
jgi:hypothetical protein